MGFLDFAFWLTRGRGDGETRGRGERFRNGKIGFFRLNMKNLPLKGVGSGMWLDFAHHSVGKGAEEQGAGSRGEITGSLTGKAGGSGEITNTHSQSPIPNPQSPIPNPQSPIPNPQSPIPNPQSPIPSPQSPVPNPQPFPNVLP